MRVLFAVTPNSLAHLYPVVPLAWAFQSAGHEVRVASHVGAAEQIMTTGLSPVALGKEPAVRMTDEGLPPKHPEDVDRYAKVMRLSDVEREDWIVFYQWLFQPISDYVRIDRTEASDLVDFARLWKPDLILWEPVFPGAAVAARAAGIPHARLMYGRDIFAWCLERLAAYRDQLRDAGLDENPMATLIRPLANWYNLEVDEDLLVGQWTVDAMPEGLRLPTRTTKIFVRHVPYAGAQVFPNWLYGEPQRPRIALSLGESVRRFIIGDWDRAPKIMQAVEGLPIEVIATLNAIQLDDVKRVPANVRTIDWVNLTHLLPSCNLLIHHGGFGTYSAAAAAGVPNLVCDIEGESLMMRPLGNEGDVMQTGTYRVGWEFGEREAGRSTSDTSSVHWSLPAKKVEAAPVSTFVAARGSGDRLDHRKQSVQEIRELIMRVATEPRYRAGAARVREEWLATPAPADIVPVLERLALRHR
jgi:UDP:flavonoid glycosyltransferase YjiC (YdhE family)